MTDHLEPCPCCESTAAMIPNVVIKRIRYCAECTNDACGLGTNNFSTEAEAIAAWNTRAKPADRALLDEVREAFRQIIKAEVFGPAVEISKAFLAKLEALK